MASQLTIEPSAREQQAELIFTTQLRGHDRNGRAVLDLGHDCSEGPHGLATAGSGIR